MIKNRVEKKKLGQILSKNYSKFNLHNYFCKIISDDVIQLTSKDAFIIRELVLKFHICLLQILTFLDRKTLGRNGGST